MVLHNITANLTFSMPYVLLSVNFNTFYLMMCIDKSCVVILIYK